MIDTDRIAELRKEIGAEDLGLVLALFLEEAAQTLARVEDGLEPHDLGRAMHFLRSGALNTGLRGFAAATLNPGDDPVAAAARLREVLMRTREGLAALPA